MDYPNVYPDYQYSFTNVTTQTICNNYNGKCTDFIYEPVEVTVGAPNLGDIFSGRDIDVIIDKSHNCSYFLLTQATETNYPILAVDVKGTVDVHYACSHSFAIRPIIRLRTSAKISSGLGTLNEPYILIN